jgi:phospholipase/carboxylesterase
MRCAGSSGTDLSAVGRRSWCGAIAVLVGLVVGVARAEAQGDLPALPLTYTEVVTGGAGADDPLPMVVGLHGLCGRPEEIGVLFDRVGVRCRVVLPRAPGRCRGGGFAWFAGSGPAPQVARGARRSADKVAALVDALAIRRPTTGKAVVTGFSQGGMLAFVVATRHPRSFRGAVPIGGWLPRELWPAPLAPPPAAPVIRSIVGERDPLVPASGARRAVTRLREAGWDVEMAEHPGVGHWVSDEMREELSRLLETWLRALPPSPPGP